MTRRLPTYNIPGVLSLRERINGDARVLGYLYEDLTAAKFVEFTELLAELLPDRIPFDTLYGSCEYLLGDELNEDSLFELAWRLAGNVRRLRNGYLVLPWAGITVKEWMPVQVVQVDFDVTRRGEPGGQFMFQFLAGQACPETATTFWPKSYCHVLAPRLGFTKFARSKYPLRDVAEFTNLRMLVRVEAGLSDIRFEEVAVPGSMREWNHRYIRMRARTLKGFSCPRKLPAGKPCFRCYYGQDKCGAAVRPETLIKGLCPQCEFIRYFDPASTATVCVGCNQQNRRQEKMQ